MSRKENYGPGGFGDQYDNQRSRSVDDDQHPGGVTGIPLEEELDFDMDFAPRKGEAFRYPGKRSEPSRDADLGLGESGTSWNRDVHTQGKGPKEDKLNDQKIREKVQDVLLHSHEVDASEIDIDVEDGVVTLKGFIASKGMQQVAEDLIGSIPSVEDVFTQLKIHDTSNFQLSEKALNEARNTDHS